MSPGLVLLLAAVAAQPAVCAPPGAADHRALLLGLNLERGANGLAPLAPHPLLCTLAAERLRDVIESGSTEADLAFLDAVTRRLYREGYTPHHWAASDLILASRTGVLDQWREVRPDGARQATAGDFEHLGVASGELAGQPVYSIFLALRKLTVERRQAAPLDDLARVRREALAAVNAARRAHGRAPLASDPRLDRAAQAHAEDMRDRGYYSHRTPEGGRVGRRVAAAGYPPARLVSENIAKGLFTPAVAVERWLASSAHRRNILRAGVREVGLGVAVGERAGEVEVYWAQVLAAKR